MNQNELIQALPQVKDIKNNRFNKLLLSNLNQTQKKDNNNSSNLLIKLSCFRKKHQNTI